MHILSGSLTVTPDGGSPRKLGPGDAAVFPRGWRGTWDLHETVRKVYVIFVSIGGRPPRARRTGRRSAG